MKRYFCWLALLGIIVLPDWASACWPLWGRPFYPAPVYYPPPVYTPSAYPSVYAYPPIVGPVTPVPSMATCPPCSSPFAPAIVTPQRIPESGTARIPAEMKPATPESAPAKAEAVRPTSGVTPVEIPTPKKTTPAPGLSTLPVQPSTTAPGGLPPLVLPKENEPRGPKPTDNNAPKKSNPAAVPSPAPADSWSPTSSGPPIKPPAVGTDFPSVMPASPKAAPAPEALIPPSAVPVIPGSNKGEALPSLSLPPVVPVTPRGEVENTSRASPLGNSNSQPIAVKQYPVAARGNSVPAGNYRAVTFFNHTSQELRLTIEGRSVKLPARSYVETKLSPSFTWSYDDHAATRERVPNDASGLDVVFGK